MTELTEYLIELGKMLGIDTDTEGCVNPNLALSARIVLAIGELERPLQWKDVADGLPEVDGKYLVQMKQFKGATVADYAERHRDSWLEYVVAYVPMKITEYEKQETTQL